MNPDRSSWADKAISAFRDATGTDREDALTDLLADLMHWADRAGYGFREALDRARSHYEAETTGDGIGAPTLQSVEDQIRHLKAREKFTEDFGYHRDVPTADGYEVQEVWEQRVVSLSWHELTHDQRLIQILDNTDIQRLPFEDKLSILQAQVEITKVSSEHHHHFTRHVERDPCFNAPASDYARTLDATARSAQPRDPDRSIDR
jgi:hypothetical protein